MLSKVMGSLERAMASGRLRGGGLRCPDCGTKAEKMPDGFNGVIECGACGTKASLAEWVADKGERETAADAETPPPGTKIRESRDAFGGRVWEIPAKGRFGFFMIFAVLWLGITALVSGGFLIAFLTGGKIEGDFPGWAMIPFFGLFWAIGLGMLYAGLREKYLTNRITVSGGDVKLRKELFGRAKEKSMPVAGIREIAQKEFYQQNYKPVYGIEIKGEKGKIRFGSGLEENEKAWLVAALRRSVFGKPDDRREQAPATGGIAPMKVKRPKEVFSVAIPAPGAGNLVPCLVFAVVGIGFVCIGIFVIDGEPLPDRSRDSSAGYWFSLVFSIMENGFRTIWLLISSLFAIMGIAMTASVLRDMGRERRIEGNSAEISIRTYRRGLITKDISFPRARVTDIRASISGSSGSTSMKRVELIVGDNAEKIAGWIEGEKADALAAEVRDALGV